MALEEAVQRGRLARNPVVLTQPPKRDRVHKKLGWTLDEARAFLDAVSDHGSMLNCPGIRGHSLVWFPTVAV